MTDYNGEILERIASLALRDDQKDELIAEFNRRRRMKILGGFEKMFDLPWGVFCEAQPDIRQARWALSEKCTFVNPNMKTTIEKIAQYVVLQQGKAQIAIPKRLCLRRIEESFDKRTLDYLRILLGRPVETIRFNETTRSEDICGSALSLGNVMEAVSRAKCCNPVIVFENVAKIKERKAKKMLRKMIKQTVPDNRYFTDKSIGIRFDLSNVVFIELVDFHLPGKVVINPISKIKVIQKTLLLPILAEFGVEDRKHLLDEDILRYVIDCCHSFGLKEYNVWLKWIAATIRCNPEIDDSSAFLKMLASKLQYEWDQRPLKLRANGPMPVGGATMLCGFPEYGSINYLETSFSKNNRIINETDIKREMIHIAFNYLRANAGKYHIPLSTFEQKLTTKFPINDGLSAGCATFLSLFSLFSNRRVRSDSATSGVITLSGRIRHISRIYAKSYSAYKAGIRRIVLPDCNRYSVECAIDGKLKEEMTFVYVETIDELIEAMMEK